jgi:geranylgeranyl diphosphate synthase type I
LAGAAGAPPSAEFEIWRNGVRQTVLAQIADFVDTECVPQLDRTGVDIASEVLVQFADAGKCLRSTFMYLGWLSAAEADGAALRACAGLELLQAFALLQDDVMDDSALRRGRPAAHVQFARWHRDHGLSGSQARFGASLATLLSDLCLVWAEQMMRESGVGQDALSRAWPHYDAMRVELAVGQIADVANDAGALPDLDTVLDLARREPLRRIELNARVSDLVVTPDGRQAILVLPRDGQGAIGLLDLKTYALSLLELGAEAHRVRVAPDGKTALVLSDRNKTAWVLR